MVRIRLRRTGAKNNPAYRIVVADARAPRDGAFIELIGHYLPTRQPHVVEIDEAKARKWLQNGAQPTDTCASLLKQKGILTSEGKLAPEGGAVAVESAPEVAAPVEAATESAPIAEQAPATIEAPVSENAPAPATPVEESASVDSQTAPAS